MPVKITRETENRRNEERLKDLHLLNIGESGATRPPLQLKPGGPDSNGVRAKMELRTALTFGLATPVAAGVLPFLTRPVLSFFHHSKRNPQKLTSTTRWREAGKERGEQESGIQRFKLSRVSGFHGFNRRHREFALTLTTDS